MGHHITKEIIARFIPSNPVIVEAGAHIGRDTEKMARFWPGATIYAFEPLNGHFEQLQTRMVSFKNVHCFKYALADTSSKENFYAIEAPYNAASSLYKPSGFQQEHPDVGFKVEKVSTITLDVWKENYQISHIDFMWLDMQGGELAALKGAASLLESVKALKVEVNLNHRYENIPLYAEIRAWLEERGFILAVEAFHRPHWGNVLFVRV